MSNWVIAVSLAIAVSVGGCAGPPDSPESPSTAAGSAAEAPAAATPAAAATTALVSGRVPVVGGGAATVVILTPASARDFPAQAAKPVMDQISLTFTPPLMIVRTGQPAEFRNSDDVLHNVRVREEATKGGTFNVALPTGGSYDHAFERDGFYDVGCDIHPGMSALIVSASTPFTAIADAQGNYSIADVPPGAYEVAVYAGSQTIERKVEIAAGSFQLDIAS